MITIATLIQNNDPFIELDCNSPQVLKAHRSVMFACRSDAIEWLKTNKFRSTDGETMFRRDVPKTTIAIISSVDH